MAAKLLISLAPGKRFTPLQTWVLRKAGASWMGTVMRTPAAFARATSESMPFQL